MAVRRWQCHADIEIPTATYGVVPAVSRENLVDAVLDGVSMLDRSGGVLSVLVSRQATDLPGEMVTTGAIIEWKDYTNAKEQPERPVSFTAPDPEPTETAGEILGEEQPTVAEVLTDANPDGLDPATLEDEDVSSIPAAAR